MPSAENVIESAIEGLKNSPGKFQRLVECYAKLIYPHRFKQIVPQGRNPNDVTVKGWPDCYSFSPDGRMDVAEATHSSAWPAHLEEDVEKAEAMGKGQFAGFLFVAWDNEPSPLAERKKTNPRFTKLMEYRNRLAALDIPPDNIDFVFKKQLIHALAQPRFAGVLKELLGLPCHSLPFKLISQMPAIFGSADRLNVFAPAKEEFLNGTVHRSDSVDEAEKGLENRGWAWIRGRGAVGKTVSAIQIALGYESKSKPAYYLDLARFDATTAEAINIIMTHADDRVLFILDNVHLDEETARDIFEHWNLAPLGSHLLLVGRDVSYINSRGTANPLDDLKQDALTLEVSPPDLAGVFLRLARRFLRSHDYYSEVPNEVLHRWHTLFGGDLVAFSAAVARRIERLTQGDWQLEARDAAVYVRETYLEGASVEDRLNLLRLAVLAQLEVAVPIEAIEHAAIRPLLHSGLVHYSRGHEQESYESYALVHPGLGSLLLTAAGYSEKELDHFSSEQIHYVMRRKPTCGPQIATRLEMASRNQEAISVWSSIIESDQRLVNALITPGFHNLLTRSNSLIRLKILSEPEIDQRLSVEGLAIRQAASHAPFYSLTSLLSYADRRLPRMHAVLAEMLDQPESLKALSEAAPKASLGKLSPFLWYAERKLPGIHATLAAVLNRPENLQALRESMFSTSLSGIVLFLRYAERNLPGVFAEMKAVLDRPDGIRELGKAAPSTSLEGIASFLHYAEPRLPKAHAAVTAVLEQSECIPDMDTTIANTSLGGLCTFLRYAQLQLPNMYAALVSALRRPENIQVLTKAAAHTSLASLASFLSFAESTLPAVSKEMNERLLEPDVVNLLANNACQSSLDCLLPLLRNAAIAPAVVAAIDRPRWEMNRLADKPEQPAFLPALDREFQRLGVPELSEAVACSLVNAAEPTQWHTPNIQASHLSQVMRLGRSAGSEAILRFLGCVVTPAWLEELYEKAHSGVLAASLFGLWGYHEELVLDHFRIPALTSRVHREIKHLDALEPKLLSGALQLLGCSALFGIHVNKAHVIWPKIRQVQEVINFAAPSRELTTIGHIQIQLWLGLRVMARLRSDRAIAEAELGDQILTLWKNSTGKTDKQKKLNVWMIDWLEQCAQSEWMLIPDYTLFATGNEQQRDQLLTNDT